MRESDDEAVRRSSVFVDTRAGAMKEGGDIVLPLQSGALAKDGIKAELADLAHGRHPRPYKRDDEITLFKSVGAALEDLAGAILAYRRCRADRFRADGRSARCRVRSPKTLPRLPRHRGSVAVSCKRWPRGTRAVLSAPPGAGKTTLVPLASARSALARRRQDHPARTAAACGARGCIPHGLAAWRDRSAKRSATGCGSTAGSRPRPGSRW